jgi:hypothetical protein
MTYITKGYNFQIGKTYIVSTRPKTWGSQAGGDSGLDKVNYPYTFTIKKIVKGINGNSIFDGKYGWFSKTLITSSCYLKTKKIKFSLL